MIYCSKCGLENEEILSYIAIVKSYHLFVSYSIHCLFMLLCTCNNMIAANM